MTAQVINLFETLIVDARNLYVNAAGDGFEIVLDEGHVVSVPQRDVRSWKRLKRHLMSLVLTQRAYRRVVASMPHDWRRSR